MILEFCITNYLSIKDELKLSFVASTLKENLSEANDTIPLSDTGMSLVRSAVIYGANASGKSNVLKALDFYKRFIIGSFKNSQAGDSIGVENFRLNSTTAGEPTTMEATFSDGSTIYRSSNPQPFNQTSVVFESGQSFFSVGQNPVWKSVYAYIFPLPHKAT